MTTSTLKLIKNAGTHTDQIFAGMFGKLNADGKFEFDESLMGLDVAKLTQLSIKKGRESFPESALHTVQAEPEVVHALKGILLCALQKRWTHRYQDLIRTQPPGVASTLTSAMEVDSMAVDASLEAMGFKNADTPLAWMDIRATYEYTNAQLRPSYGNNTLALSSSTLSAVSRVINVAVNAATPIDGQNQVPGHLTNFFHGTAEVEIQIPIVTNDDALVNKLVQTVLKFPVGLLDCMNLVTDCRLTSEPEFSEAPKILAGENRQAQTIEPANATTALIEGEIPPSAGDAHATAAQFLEGAIPPQVDNADDDDDGPAETPATA